jgi:hypothetical protein
MEVDPAAVFVAEKGTIYNYLDTGVHIIEIVETMINDVHIVVT